MPKKENIAKKEAAQAEKGRKVDEQRERDEAAQWEKGAKDNSKAATEAAKDEEKRRKAAEKAALLAAEEAEAAGIKKVTSKPKKDAQAEMFAAALAAAPKSKAQKEAELRKKQAEENKLKEIEAREAREAQLKAEEDQRKKYAAKGMVINHTDELLVPINNRIEEDDFEDVSGIDGALDTLSVKDNKADDHPERRRKALYAEYYSIQLPVIKEEQPGLKLSQYKERIFEMWKSAPENPDNQKKSTVFKWSSSNEPASAEGSADA